MTKRKQIQQPDYDYRDTYEELYGVAVVGKNGKFGYIDHSGVEITPLKYDRAMRFYWNAGRVQLNGKWGLVNKQGKEITPPVYDEIKGHQDPIVRLGDKYGYVSRKTGELLTPVKYDEAKQWTQILDFSSHKFEKKDLALVQLDGKWGCVNLCGEEIIPVKYEKIDINQFRNPRVAAKLNGKWGFISENGKEITAFEYDDVEEFHNCRAREEKDGKYGFIDTQGAVVVPLVYDDCEWRFTTTYCEDDERVLPVWVKRNGKYGFIDIAGNEIIEPEYELVQPFDSAEDGQALAAVVLNGAAGFIDQTGKSVIPCMYEPDFDNQDSVNQYNYRFFNGFADVKFNGKWGVIDAKGNVVIPFLYDEFLENRHAGFRYAMRDGKKLSIDTKGNEWEMQKNPDARTFMDYLHAVTWADVAESFRTLICVNKETVDDDLKIYELNFHNFKNKQFKPSKNIIRICANYGTRPPVDAHLFCVEDECSYVIFDWEEILDMEIRLEDNLTLTGAEIVAVCIWGASDQVPATEEGIKSFINKLKEQEKTTDENGGQA
jgi:hypothetical protein